jgi:hypothetical protein
VENTDRRLFESRLKGMLRQLDPIRRRQTDAWVGFDRFCVWDRTSGYERLSRSIESALRGWIRTSDSVREFLNLASQVSQLSDKLGFGFGQIVRFTRIIRVAHLDSPISEGDSLLPPLTL